MRRLLGVVIALLIFSGAFAQTDSGAGPGQAIIESKLGKNADKSTNKDNTFTLYKAVKDNASGVPVLNYIVVRNGDKKIVLEGAVTMGVIDWSADYELEEGRSLGSGTGKVSNTRKIDLRPFLK